MFYNNGMLIAAIYIPTSNLPLSLSFYKRVFADEERTRKEGLVTLYSGVTLCTESKWSEMYGIGSEYREKGVLGINIVLETTGFDRFLHHLSMLKDRNSIIYKPLENIDGKLQITLIDPDMNLVTVRESSLGEATLSEEHDAFSVNKKLSEECVFFKEKSVEDCVND